MTEKKAIKIKFPEFDNNVENIYQEEMDKIIDTNLADASTTRTLKKITLEDAAMADETFSLLMGEKVEPRKEFIERNAKYAVNLDF